VLDGVQDPGNLGTIIRTCDWFGVHEIVCSRDTADCYNPKVVQATMGALARVNLRYLDLVEWLEGIRNQESGIRIYGTLLDGKNMYEVLDGTLGTCANEVHADRRAEAGVARQFSGAVLTFATLLPNANL
jgi:tRNA G18 (ribose-2'-O)-methylase SpoU